MNYEKKYKEALERARKLYEQGTITESLCYVFPELKESEDEKIRKELITHCRNTRCVTEEGAERIVKWIAWLEKQGVQSSDILHDVNEEPEEQREIFCEWESSDAIWHDVAFYHADTKTFWHGGQRIEDVVKWAYVNEMLEKKGEQKSYDACDSSMTDNKKFPYGEKRDFGYFEEKPINKIEPKFHEGDLVVSDITGTVYQIKKCIETPNNHKYGYILINGGYISTDEINHYHLWDITKDAKDGDVLCYKDEISLYKHDIKNCTKQETTFGGFVYHCCYDGKRFITDSLYSLTEQDKMDIHPATKEQREQLEKAMADSGYTFDFEKKELRKIENEIEIPFSAKDSELQEATYYIPKGFHAEIEANNVIIKKGEQKSAWSEEDKELMKWSIINLTELKDSFGEEYGKVGDCIDWLESLKEKVQHKHEWSEKDEKKLLCICAWIKDYPRIADFKDEMHTVANNYIDWLKSLRPQNTWKPSEEQMKALSAINLTGEISYAGQGQELINLYNDLKKLKGE